MTPRVEDLVEGFRPHPGRTDALIVPDADGRAVALVVISELTQRKPGSFYLEELQALVPGGGRRAMQIILDRADRMGATIYIVPEPLIPMGAGHKLSERRLRSWYREFGFETVRGSQREMVRRPLRQNPMPRNLKEFGKKLREVINSDDVFAILNEGDWGAGGCWILAEALVQFLGPPARLMVLSRRLLVDHVLVEYAGTYIDYNVAQSSEELTENNAQWLGTESDLVPFTKRLQRIARGREIPCEPWQVKRLLSALQQAFARENPRKAQRLRVRPSAHTPYDVDTRSDVAKAVVTITGEDEDEVRAGLENGAILNVVLVSPAELLRVSGPRDVSSRAVEEYAEVWATGIDTFPPIVINSKACTPLIEGGHRTVSAAEAGIPWIRAVDVAGARVVRTPEGLETYAFGR